MRLAVTRSESLSTKSSQMQHVRPFSHHSVYGTWGMPSDSMTMDAATSLYGS